MKSPKGEISWLDKRSRMEKYFVVIISILAIVIVLLIIGLSCPGCKTQFCLTPECVKSAGTILDSLDRNVDPCHDFYRFACGNTIRTTVIPKDKPLIDRFSVIEDEIEKQLRTILEEPIQEGEIKPITLAKKYFQACMNTELIEEQGRKNILDLYQTLGGWPVLEADSWDEERFVWRKLMYQFRKLGLNTNIFIKLSVDADLKNSSVYIVTLDQAFFALPREYLTTNTHIDTYLNLMVNIAVQLEANRSRAEEEFKELLDFEIKLANIALPAEERHNMTKLSNHMSIRELKVKYPKTPWLDYINFVLRSEDPLTDDDIVLVMVPSYLSSFENLIEVTPKRVLANYALWKVTLQTIEQMPEEIYKHFFEAIKIMTQVEGRTERWKKCVQDTKENLPFIVSSLYVRKHFDEAAKKKVLEIVDSLKNAFKDILKNLKWMDADTRKHALDKAENIMDHVGYPEELLNDKVLEDYYDKLETYEDQYLKSNLNTQLHQTNFQYSHLRKYVNKTAWTDYGNVATVQATYEFAKNSIFFSAAILQGVFYNKNRPHYLNFGAIGSIIGHEISHGFDDQGRQFDGYGNLVNWWNPKTEKLFLNKTQCMIAQYGSYTIPEININVNGVTTQSENIADNGGIKEAYLAYNAWVDDNKEEPKLPGLEKFSNHQLYWISAAMNWCANYNPAQLNNTVATDSHAPNEFRVLGPFSNSVEFSKDFNCSQGSRMNPLNKCAVW